MSVLGLGGRLTARLVGDGFTHLHQIPTDLVPYGYTPQMVEEIESALWRCYDVPHPQSPPQ